MQLGQVSQVRVLEPVLRFRVELRGVGSSHQQGHREPVELHDTQRDLGSKKALKVARDVGEFAGYGTERVADTLRSVGVPNLEVRLRHPTG